ncbi:MAG TPA: hypothetical protein VNA87_05170 [Actinomycetota bacterium]|nr:hypothetical protein [Actinomycetota bacterium]
MSIRRFAALAALGFGPMILGHLSAYVLAAPDPNARRVLLESTGHGSFHLVIVFSLMASMLGIWRLARHSLLRARDGYQFATMPSARSVVIIQGGLYIGLEFLERATSGGLGSLLIEPAFQIGLCLQILTALIVILKVRAISLIVARLVGVRPRRRLPSWTPRLFRSFADDRRCDDAISRRGPPLALYQ